VFSPQKIEMWLATDSCTLQLGH